MDNSALDLLIITVTTLPNLASSVLSMSKTLPVYNNVWILSFIDNFRVVD